MSFVGWARRCAVGIFLCASLSGCLPNEGDALNEKKEPHYLRGMSLVSQMDYQGAMDEFEKSLEVDPRSASAHFELGWLYEEKVTPPDLAAAIYHYDRYLKFSSNPDKADLVRQRINSCKLELVKTVSALGPMPSAQRELERIAGENKDLRDQVAALQAQLAQARTAAASAARTATVVTPPVTPMITPLPPFNPSPPAARPIVASGNRGSPVAFRKHVVKAGETMAAIARSYNVSVNALEAANPQAKPSHLLVGQTLNIPSP